ncbi:MAG TPA: hypothetical protein VHP11_17575 [Tepidisphaeraceae bacterium]|nr:hypothetical protein [Tepidisphaeraceae bacterium]
MMRDDAMVLECRGGELYHAMQRLVAEWHSCDASEQARLLPQLLTQLTQLAQGYTAPVARLAAHDAADAA